MHDQKTMIQWILIALGLGLMYLITGSILGMIFWSFILLIVGCAVYAILSKIMTFITGKTWGWGNMDSSTSSAASSPKNDGYRHNVTAEWRCNECGTVRHVTGNINQPPYTGTICKYGRSGTHDWRKVAEY